ncbi:MAG TPA: hypothetical protein VM053_00655 [Gemmatimonadaceae bacterium]|nr:hypothetical protein [Gemmatimonadaceae bacterium]
MAFFGITRGLPVLLTAVEIKSGQRRASDLLLGVVDGYEITNASVVRYMRIASLMGASATIVMLSVSRRM